MIKKFFVSPLFLIAVLCFILAGIFSLFPTQKMYSLHKAPIQIITPKPTEVLGQETTQNPTPVMLQKTAYPPTTAYPAQTTTTSTTTTTTSTESTSPQVSMTVSEPDGTNTFTINYHDGMNACDSLTEAKTEGKIRSVTIDNSYQSTLHSSYVKEINGYSNNWTFTVNGQAPNGCSLYVMHQGDNIVWKYD